MPKEGLCALILAQLHTFPASADSDTPVTVTKSMQIVPDDDPEAWLSFSIKLIDFGVACYADRTDEHFTQEVFPSAYVP
ncbi:hypothetical protein ARMGADRAFT_1008660 [Armillaria gallica]|uniref:Protein kinase domain-containing protein n=1 Tax=Armillaria gallica TaxID=47427 RepID=A0A2H3DWF3_ARMGA|nr:hypothetical protein ARMGADRAFT_1008660 [Armillaria gallica]